MKKSIERLYEQRTGRAKEPEHDDCDQCHTQPNGNSRTETEHNGAAEEISEVICGAVRQTCVYSFHCQHQHYREPDDSETKSRQRCDVKCTTCGAATESRPQGIVYRSCPGAKQRGSGDDGGDGARIVGYVVVGVVRENEVADSIDGQM